MNISSLKSRYEKAKASYNTSLGRQQASQESIVELNKQRGERIQLDLMYKEEQAVLNKAGARQLETAARNLTAAVNYTVPKVFGSAYEELKIETDTSGNGTTANIVLYKNENGESYGADPYENNGGSICDPVSIMLKLGALVGYQPTVENALLADEPSKHVSEEYRAGLADVFLEVSHNSRRQMIISTHDPALTVSADKVITLT